MAVAMVVAGCEGVGPTPVPAQTAPYDQHSRYHTGSVATPEYWARSPWDRYAMEVRTKADPARSGSRLERFVVRTFEPDGYGEGERGKVVYSDDRWYPESRQGPEFHWDRESDRVWLLVGRSPYEQGRSEIRSVVPGPDGTWVSRVMPPEEDPALPQWIRDSGDRLGMRKSRPGGEINFPPSFVSTIAPGATQFDDPAPSPHP
ncbi:hypothetical protein B4N89_04255 [Embleya scabrispora]|uniref:Uncharacterized protein n=1 Tax=Embleya scabrispora TaxID=159449 RepID=A0A1T3NUA4_9ACTN|nr:hypothetical protein [Embleya scabrispora]OPC80262.1 hypothetical protein B4N89_04255 [Embleya scabrispora]